VYWKGGGVDQVNESQKCRIGRLTETLAAQLATAPQLSMDADEEEEPEVVVFVDEFGVLAADVC
jgi:hypothetical protein